MNSYYTYFLFYVSLFFTCVLASILISEMSESGSLEESETSNRLLLEYVCSIGVCAITCFNYYILTVLFVLNVKK